MSSIPVVTVTVFGQLSVAVDGEALALGGTKPRSILAILVLGEGRAVAAESLVERIWGEDAGESSFSTLQVHISNLRRSLSAASEAAGDEVIATRNSGYLFAAPPESVDLYRYQRLTDEARNERDLGRTAAAADLYIQASTISSAEPLSDLRSQPWWDDAVRPIERQVRATRVEGLTVGLEAGRHAELQPVIEAMVESDPLDEGLRGLLMLALYRSGRQADALAVFKATRSLLIEELGIEPGAELRDLQGRILAQDSSLELSSRPAADLEFTTALRSSLLVKPATIEMGGKEVALQIPVTTIGRRETQNIVLDDPQASRCHLVVRVEAGRYIAEDASSMNGTKVNGELLTGPRTLNDGDAIRIGSTLLVFRQND